MSDKLKFPNHGYEVVVLRKQDVLDCIDKNIIDKEVALAIVENCEKAATRLLTQGRWVGIPFIGNIRLPKVKQLESTPEQQALIQEARDLLKPEDYIIFRKKLSIENTKQIKHERYYKYITSVSINKHKDIYNRLCKQKGAVYARLFLFSIYNVVAVDNEYIRYKDYE